MARYLDPELHEIVSAQNAEIERLGFELKSWKESYKTLLEETERLRSENAKLLGDRLLGKSRLMQKDLKEYIAEVKRLREELDSCSGCMKRADLEIERLRQELAIEKGWVKQYRNGYIREVLRSGGTLR